jgi:hypothetical protein
MAIAFVTSSSAASSDGTLATTSGVNTTGATLIVLAVASYSNATIPNPTDSKSNTWTHLTSISVSTDVVIRMHYCLNPTVGSGHTFSVSTTSCFPSICMQAFSGVRDFEQETGHGTSSTVTTLQPGPLTPGENNCLVLSAVANSGSSISASGYTVASRNYGPGTNFGSALGYKIETTAAAADAAWTWTTATKAAAANAVFLATSPIITSNGGGSTASISVAENTTAVTTVTAFTTSTVSFTIGGGIDQDRFELDGLTGVLSFAAGQFAHGAPDFELSHRNTYREDRERDADYPRRRRRQLRQHRQRTGTRRLP